MRPEKGVRLARTMKRPKGQRPELLDDAKAFKERRERMDWTQEELADQLAVERNTIARWETAQNPIPPIALRLLFFVEQEARRRAYLARRRKVR